MREVVAAGRLASGGLLGPLRRRDRAIVAEAIERVGLGDSADVPLRTLSGGQQQRAFIAKALAGQPSLLVLDEPTTGVDVEAQEALADLLDRLHRELAVTVLYVSHEFGAVERFVERLVLVRGGIVFDGPPEKPPRRLARPVARPCLTSSSCGSPSPPARSSACSRRRSASSSSSGSSA